MICQNILVGLSSELVQLTIMLSSMTLSSRILPFCRILETRDPPKPAILFEHVGFPSKAHRGVFYLEFFVIRILLILCENWQRNYLFVTA